MTQRKMHQTQNKHMILKSIIALVLSVTLLSTPLHAAVTKDKMLGAGIAATTGAAAGGVTFAVVGTGGMVIAGTALSIGAAPFVGAGAVVGLAGYGIYRIFR